MGLAKGLRTPREFDFRGQWDLITELGKCTLGGNKQNLVHTRNQEKGAVRPQEMNSEFVGAASGQTTGREYSPTYQQNIGLKIY